MSQIADFVMSLRVVLAQAGELVLPEAASVAPAEAPPDFTTAAAAGGAIALVTAAYLVWRMIPPPDPGEGMFAEVARRLGLSRADRRLLREWARALHLPGPMPLLLSGHARRAAAMAAGTPAEQAEAVSRKIPGL